MAVVPRVLALRNPPAGCLYTGIVSYLWLPAFADKGQILEVVQMRKVSSAVEKTRAAISDDREDRFSTRFNQHVSFVVPPDGHGKSWYLNDGFGIEHLPKVELRWLNLGIGNGQKRRLGGFEVTSPLFNVCRHCGHLDSEAGANSRWDHRPWCPHRYEQKEDTVSFALGRTLKTQGVLMLLPEYFGSEADSMVVTSLIAAIKLGFREVLGGDPDHLDVTSVQVPVLLAMVHLMPFCCTIRFQEARVILTNLPILQRFVNLFPELGSGCLGANASMMKGWPAQNVCCLIPALPRSSRLPAQLQKSLARNFAQ